MKTVWLLNHYANCPGEQGFSRHASLATHLRSFGYQVIVVASSRYLHSDTDRLAADQKYQFIQCDGVSFLFVRTRPSEGSLKKRSLSFLDYFLRTIDPRVTRDLVRPDVVIGSSVHPLAGLAAAVLAKRHHVPFIFEVRDLWPETLIQFGFIGRNSVAARLLRVLEGQLYRRAHRVVSTLPYAAEYIARFGVSRHRVVWISNGVDLDEYPPATELEDDGARPLTLMYFGSHGQANDLNTMLEAFALVASESDRTVHLRLIGEGPDKPALQQRAKQLKLEDAVSFEPARSKQELMVTAREADLFLLNGLDRPELYRYGISMNKLFDYMALARPIVMAITAPIDPLEGAKCSLKVRGEDVRAKADAILHILSLPLQDRRELGTNGRTFCEQHFDYSMLARKYARLLDRLTT